MNDDGAVLAELEKTFNVPFTAERGGSLGSLVWRFRALLYYPPRSFDVRLYRWSSRSAHTEIAIHEQLYGSAIDARRVEQVVAAPPLECVPMLKLFLDELTR